MVYSSHNLGDNRVRYLRCNLCGKRPANNKVVVPKRYLSLRRHYQK